MPPASVCNTSAFVGTDWFPCKFAHHPVQFPRPLRRQREARRKTTRASFLWQMILHPTLLPIHSAGKLSREGTVLHFSALFRTHRLKSLKMLRLPIDIAEPISEMSYFCVCCVLTGRLCCCSSSAPSQNAIEALFTEIL